MATNFPPGKEMAGAIPLFVFIAYRIVVVLASKICGEFRKGDTVRFFSITFRFFNLTNETGLHLELSTD